MFGGSIKQKVKWRGKRYKAPLPTIPMIMRLLGLALILIGALFLKYRKSTRWIPAPEGQPHEEHITIDYTKIIFGIISIMAGLRLLFS